MWDIDAVGDLPELPTHGGESLDMECERVPKCQFFHDKLPNPPKDVEEQKQKYCLGDKTQCARYMVVTVSLPVPETLFPSDVETARRMRREAGIDV